MAITYKKSEDGKSILMDEAGLPIVVDDVDDKEFGLDAIHLFSKVPALQEEAKTHRLKAKEYGEKLVAFEGIDPEKALEALKLAENLSAGDLTKKEEVERIKLETENAWRGKMEDLQTSHVAATGVMQGKIDEMDGDLRTALLSTQFATSPHFSGKEPMTMLTPDIAEAYFGKHFKIEKNDLGVREPVGYIGDNVIYSKKRPGEIADFSESMAAIIDNYPMKDAILHKSKGSGAPGGGGRRGQTIAKGDSKAFGDNLEEIAKGTIEVV